MCGGGEWDSAVVARECRVVVYMAVVDMAVVVCVVCVMYVMYVVCVVCVMW